MSSASRRSLRGVVAGAGVLLAGSFGTQAVMLLGSVIAARVLGVEQRGSLALFATVSLVVAQIASLGLPVGVTYAVAREGGHGIPIAHAVRRYLPLPTIVAAVATGALVPLIDRSLATPAAVGLAALLTAALLWHNVGLAFLEGAQAHRAVALQRFVPAGLYGLVVGVVFLTGQASLIALCAGYAVAYAFAAAATWLHAGRMLEPEGDGAPSIPLPRVGALLRFGTRSLGRYLSAIETFRLDLIVVGVFLGAHALGLYVVALAFAIVPLLSAQSLSLALYPAIAQAKSRAAATRLVAVGAVAVVVATSAIALITIQLSPWLVAGVFGEAFVPAVPALHALQLASIAMGTRILLVTAARGIGRPGIDGIAELASLPVLAAGLLIAVAARDLRLVGIAMLAAYAVGSFVVAGLLLRTTRGPWRSGSLDRPLPVLDGTSASTSPPA